MFETIDYGFMIGDQTVSEYITEQLLFQDVTKPGPKLPTTYFQMSHAIHVKFQWYSMLYLASLFFLTLVYLVLIAKRKNAALIIATSFFLLGNSIGVGFAYSLNDAQKDTWHAWLKAHMKWNNALCAVANLSYGYAMYILIIK